MTDLQILYLSQNQLIGIIPSQLGNLKNLNRLDLTSNYLISPLPNELKSLSSLSYLAIGTNNFQESFPLFLKSLTNLTDLWLRNNQFKGTIYPSFFSSLLLIQNIDLINNQIEGEIPSEIGLCSNLIKLSIERNEFTSSLPTEMGRLFLLETLEMRINHFNGTIPTEIGFCKNLKLFSGSFNSFSGSIPTELLNLKNLQWLDFMNNQLFGTIPPFYLPYLRNIYLSFNFLNGTIPSSIFNQNTFYLGNIELNHNLLTGTLPNWSNLWISKIDVSSNQLSGSIPSSSRFPDTFNIQMNQFNGTIPSNLRGITTLNIGDNKLTGTFPSQISSKTIIVSRNFISGTLSPTFQLDPSVIQFDISDNQLSGTLPPLMFERSQAKKIDLSGNLFTGEFPSVFSYRTLEVIYLQHNSFKGTLPNAKNFQCQELVISGNNFEGKIPEFGQWRNLEVLDLSYNQMTGSISKEDIEFSSVTTFLLSGNRFSGEIPPFLSNFTRLQEIRVDNNKLEGEIGLDFTKLERLSIFDVSGNSFWGNIQTQFFELPRLTFVHLANNLFDFDLLQTPFALKPNYTSLLSGNLFPCPLPVWCSPWNEGGNGECVPCVSDSKDNGIEKRLVLAIGITIPLMVLILISLGIIIWKYRKSQTLVQISSEELDFEELIGEGRFTSVWRASLRQTTMVAVKEFKIETFFLEPEQQSEQGGPRTVEQVRRNLLQQIQVLSKLSPHPNIIQFLGIMKPNQNQQNLKVVSEFMKYGSLQSFIQRNLVDEKQLSRGEGYSLVLDLFKSISAGMNHLHQAKILHYSLCCRNIFVQIQSTKTRRDTTIGGPSSLVTYTFDSSLRIIPKISDFGVAQKPLTRWSPPELLNSTLKSPFLTNLKSFEQKSKCDIWSFGVTLFEIMTGCKSLPYTELDEKEVITFVLRQGKIKKSPEWPESIYEVMFSCWSFFPQNRPTFQELYNRLHAEEILSLSSPSSQNASFSHPSEKSSTSTNNVIYSPINKSIEMSEKESFWEEGEEGDTTDEELYYQTQQSSHDFL